MNAREFHATSVGAKLRASIGTAPHIAKVLEKDIGRRKFFLRFHLKNGEVRKMWRNAARCDLLIDPDVPMGYING